MSKRYILWNPEENDGRGPPRNDDNEINTGGILGGAVGPDNVSVSIYASNKRNRANGQPMSLDDLEPHGVPLLADFALSGEKATHEIYRVS